LYFRVYKGVHEETGDIVALKVMRLRTDTCAVRGCAAACPGHIPAEVQEEMDVMDAMHHANVVRLVHERLIQGFDFPCTMGRNAQNVNIVQVVPAFALVIEWCEYGTLLDLLMHAEVQNLLTAEQTEAVALSYFRQLVVAVQALHAAGLYHLDIKAENVFLTYQPAPVAPAAAAADGAAVAPALPVEPRHLLKLADFGTATRIDVRDAAKSVLLDQAFWLKLITNTVSK
jgi:serine/threonine protein kinase